MPELFGTGDIARRMKRPVHQIQRAILSGRVPLPRKLGIRYAVALAEVPAIEAAVRELFPAKIAETIGA